MTEQALNRREFLRNTVGGTAGLVIGFYFPAAQAAAESSPSASFAPNAFIRIGSDDSITILINKSEMGQGVYTSLPMIAAEELDADWTKIRAESAPVAPAYNHTVYGTQMTGGSSSVSSSYAQLRKAGAVARSMLIAAAAATWGVPASACTTENGFVSSGSHRASYGQLAEKASQLSPSAEVTLKNPKDFRIIGKPVARLDTREKARGTGVFGIDVKVPGMLVAVVARPPVFGGRAASFDATKTKGVAGVRHVVSIDSGIAVVAEGFWSATRGRDALEVKWDSGAEPLLDSQAQRREYAELAEKPGVVARNDGDAIAAISASTRKLEAVYEFPYLAHATMEPLNCVADVRSDSCEIWTGTQVQTMDRDAAAEITGLPKDKVRLHTTLLGGGFGRRAVPSCHFVREAVQVSKQVKSPVKVIWTREDDMRGGYYRPAYHHKIAGALDANGYPLAWAQRVVGQSIIAGTPFEPGFVKNGIDPTSVEGAADLPYAIPNVLVDLHTTKAPVPVLWMRSVGHTHTAFIVESFLDEMAHAAGKDAYELRRSLLRDNPRHKGVLELAAEKAGWGQPLPRGRGRGIAVHKSFGSYVAYVAEVSVESDGTPRVHRVVGAVDCGQVVNPAIIKAQIQGAVVFALSAAVYGEITFHNGQVQQSNFNDYPVVRMEQCPEIEVHIVPSSEPHGGIGEPGVPPLAPAVCNAIFAATGQRIRRLPIKSGTKERGN
jgi:isoquinoline 1-oxidoreductase beta subunit